MIGANRKMVRVQGYFPRGCVNVYWLLVESAEFVLCEDAADSHFRLIIMRGNARLLRGVVLSGFVGA